MADVHPTAIISGEADLGAGVRVGPYAVIEGPVVVGPGVHVRAHAVIYGPTRLGAGVEVWPMAVVGGDPQDLGYDGGPTELEIGARTVIREGATVERATNTTAPTAVGADCLIMAQAHVAHDCRVGDGVVIAQGAALGGHVHVGDGVVIGGLAGIHQHVRIGAFAMVGGMAKLTQDALPFSLVDGRPARHRRINTRGLRRAGMTDEADAAARAALWAVRDGIPVVDGNDAAKAISAFAGETSRRGLAPFGHPPR
jgi:UDP-N-acetylglucosamine acyltransferase